MFKDSKFRLLVTFLAVIAIALAIPAAVVATVDPFFQYHAPIFGSKTPITDSYNQVYGTISHFDYNTLLVGDSLAENNNTDYLESVYGEKVIKVVKESGTVPDLLWLVKRAEEKRDVKKIYWCLNLSQFDNGSSLIGEEQENYYLYTDSILDDVPYLFNKEILFNTIPTMFFDMRHGNNLGGRAYDWSDSKFFGKEALASFYVKPEADMALKQNEYVIGEEVRSAFDLIADEIEAHPDIDYVFYAPPVSMYYYNVAYVSGDINRIYVMWERIFETLVQHDNVSVYGFLTEEDIICNLDNYMDLVHYAPGINQWVMEQIVADNGRITEDNCKQYVDGLKLCVERIEEMLGAE